MEIPSYEDLHEIQSEINKVGKKLDKLIECLDIDKHFIINGRKFNTRVASQFINDQQKEFMKKYPNSSGCFGEPTIEIFPGKI